MKVIETHVEIGEDRVLRVPLPEDAPTGPVDVVVVLNAHGVRPRTAEERRAAAEAGRGALKGYGISVEEFLAERRADEERREKALGGP